MKKSRINQKELAKKFVVVSAAAVLAVATFFGGTKLHAKSREKILATDAQVTEIAQELETEDFFKSNEEGQCERLLPNKNEPIYVSFSDFYANNPEYAKQAERALEYVFKVAGLVNTDYRYEIVSEKEVALQRLLGKTTISFGNADTNEEYGRENANGIHTTRNAFIDNFFSGNHKISHIIGVDFNKIEKQYCGSSIDEKTRKSMLLSYLYYVHIHELAHCFGFDDVYEKDVIGDDHRRFFNTIMETGFGPSYPYFTPNDFKMFQSVCAPKFDSEKEKAEYTKEQAEIVELYEKAYHEARAKYLFEDSLADDFAMPGMISHFESSMKLYHDSKVIEQNNYVCDIKNGKYKLEITDKDGNFLDSVSGKAFATDNFIVLDSAEFKTGLVPIVDNTNYPAGLTAPIYIFKNDYGDIQCACSDDVHLTLENVKYAEDDASKETDGAK